MPHKIKELSYHKLPNVCNILYSLRLIKPTMSMTIHMTKPHKQSFLPFPTSSNKQTFEKKSVSKLLEIVKSNCCFTIIP